MKNFLSSSLIVVSFFFLFLSSCNNKPKPPIVDKRKELKNVHFYIDVTASMGGYFKNETEFKNIVTDLVTKIEQNIQPAPLDIWLTSEKPVRYTNSIKQFNSDIATTTIANKNGYQLHDMIQKIADGNDTNDISLLVSDCILSFPDEKIEKNPEINKTDAPTSLKTSIYSTFSNLRKKGYATTIYAFKSKFYGKYYNYQNHPTELNGANRPFYLIVIGDKELLTRFNTQLLDVSEFIEPGTPVLNFGLTEEAITKFDINPQIERKGSWMSQSGKGLTDVDCKKSPLQFCVTCNLDNLPSYAREIKYLQDNIAIDNSGCKVTFEVKDKNDVDKSKLKSMNATAQFDRASHVIIFKVNEMVLPEANIHALLPLKYDAWYLDWNCDDDKRYDMGDKTFALKYFIEGVKEAYQTSNKNYIDFSISLNK